MSKRRTDFTPDKFMQLASGRLPDHLGIIITAIDEGRVEARMAIERHHLAPNDYLHAGSIVALADTACGCGALAHLPEGAASFTTIELKSNHLASLRDGEIVCLASARHLGRQTQVWDAEVSDAASGRRLALFRCTQMVLGPKS